MQFGKYAFAGYDICVKMPIFHRVEHICAGIEIVPMRNFTYEMSTGVIFFEQIAWDLHHRGTSDIDIPVLVLGIDADLVTN